MSHDDKDQDLRLVDAGLAETVEALNALPSEAMPPRDLWPGIQERIAAERRPVHLGIASRHLDATPKPWWSRSVTVPWAIAASLLLASAIGVGTWQLAQRGTLSQLAEVGASGLEAADEGEVIRTVADDLSSPNYDQAVIGLRETYEAGKGKLAPETVAVLEQSLDVMNQAIAEARAAIEADPARDEVRRMLHHIMNRKLDVLRQAAAAVQDRA